MSDRILVTGGAGFIGSELVRQLAEAGHQVLVVDNLVNGRRSNLASISPKMMMLEQLDIRDTDRLLPLLNGVTVIYHLACLGVRHSIHAPFENHDVNAAGTLKLLIAARKAGVPRFVYVSSSEVYGTGQRMPMTEDHPTRPTTVYGASKLAGECYTRAFYETYGYPTIVVRPFNTYGPRSHHEGDCGEVIPKFLLRSLARKPMVIFGDGLQTRDFTYVSDTARGIFMAGFRNSLVGRTINLGTGAEICVRDLAQRVASVTDWNSPAVVYEAARPGDVRRLFADVSVANRELGFKATVTLEEGLARLRDWYAQSEQSPHELLEAELVRNWEVKVRGDVSGEPVRETGPRRA